MAATTMVDQATLSMQDRGPEVLAVVIVFFCISTCFIILRLISRLGVVKRVSNDDYAILIAWVSDIFVLGRCYRVLIGGSWWPLVSPSPSAMEQVLDWAATK